MLQHAVAVMLLRSGGDHGASDSAPVGPCLAPDFDAVPLAGLANLQRLVITRQLWE
jgi:hypothetical protein